MLVGLFLCSNHFLLQEVIQTASTNMKQILIINGHPNPNSYVKALAEAYYTGAQASQYQVELLHLNQLDFDPNLQQGYQAQQALEADLAQAIEQLKAADHLVWCFPMWWYSYPALMKGFIDRTFLPNIAFKYTNKPFPEQLFKGKTARLVITADSPKWYNKWVMGQPVIKQLKKGTLGFCGIHPVKTTYIAPIRKSSEAFRVKRLQQLEQLGRLGQ